MTVEGVHHGAMDPRPKLCTWDPWKLVEITSQKLISDFTGVISSKAAACLHPRSTTSSRDYILFAVTFSPVIQLDLVWIVFLFCTLFPKLSRVSVCQRQQTENEPNSNLQIRPAITNTQQYAHFSLIQSSNSAAPYYRSAGAVVWPTGAIRFGLNLITIN